MDTAGNAYVTGYTESKEPSFPVKVGPDLTFNSATPGLSDAFVARVTTDGKALVYCGYIGGSQHDEALGITLDNSGNAYVTGETLSDQQTFPVKVGPDPSYNGGTTLGGDAFVAKVALILLQGSGTLQPGTSVPLTLTASDSAGLSYVIGSSLGTGPIKIGTRTLGLSPDNLLLATVNNYWPTIFAGYRGVIGTNGQATAKINLPKIAGLVGQKIHTAFVTVSSKSPQGIKSISNTYSFTITK